MCDPVTGAVTFGSVLSGASTAFSVFSAFSGAMTSSANAKAQDQQFRYQAQINENNALAIEQATAYEADLLDAKKRRYMSEGQVRMAKSGVVINQDTPLAVQVDTASEFEAERRAILYRGRLGAAAERNSGTGNQFAAATARANAKNAAQAGFLNVVSILGTDAEKAGLIG